jgi:hypothetical protein
MGMYHTINIGVKRRDGGPDLALPDIFVGWPITVPKPNWSGTYPTPDEATIVLWLSTGWEASDLVRLCEALGQDCIAGMGWGGGGLHGPKAEIYAPFDQNKFVEAVRGTRVAPVGPRVTTAHRFDQLSALLRDARQRLLDAEERVAYAQRMQQDAETAEIEAKEAFDDYIEEALTL